MMQDHVSSINVDCDDASQIIHQQDYSSVQQGGAAPLHPVE